MALALALCLLIGEGSSSSSTIKIGFITPIVTRSTTATLDTVFADVAGSGLMPGYNFTYSTFQDLGDQSVGIFQAVAAANQGVQGVIGTSTSAVSMMIQLVLRTSQIPQLSYQSKADELSDKDAYPYFVRNLAPDRFQAQAMVDVIVHYNWTRLAAISSTDVYGSDGIAAFLLLAAAKDIEILSTQVYNVGGFFVNVRAQITALKKSGARIFVHFGSSGLSVLSEAWSQGLVGPDYVWIGSDASSFSMRNITGMISFQPLNPYGPVLDDFQTRIRALATSRGFTALLAPTTGYIYDSVWLFARAFDRAIRAGQSPTNGSAVLRALYAEDGFTGTTGPTYFDSRGDRHAPFSVFNLDNQSRFAEVGMWDAENGLLLQTPLIFASGSESPPPDRLIILPVVVASSPISATTTVDVLSVVSLTFNIPMDNATSSLAFSLREESGQVVPGSIEWANQFQFVTYTPSQPLKADTTYRVTFLRTGASQEYGDHPKADYSYSFATARASQVTEATVHVESKVAAIAAPVVVVGILIIGAAITVDLVRRARRKRMVMHTYSIETSNKIDYKDIVLIKSVGMGSFGEVFRATWRGADVAVKAILASILTPKVVEEFVKETQLISQLRHPNIVLFMGMSTEPPVIVTEFMTRGSLYDTLSNKDIEIGLPLKLKWATEVAHGMLYLHASKVLHRDLKSLNILLDHNWTAKITDFGLSSIKDATAEAKSENVGSLYWTAPEVFADANNFCPASDVFSYGIVLWEILTRREPYALANQYRVAVDVMRGALRPDVTGVDKAQTELCSRCWAQDAAERPTWQMVAEDLRALVPPGEQLKFPVIAANGEVPKGNMLLVVVFIPCFAERIADLAKGSKALDALMKTLANTVKTAAKKNDGYIVRTYVDSTLVLFQTSRQSGAFVSDMMSWLWGIAPFDAASAFVSWKNWDKKVRLVPPFLEHLLSTKHCECVECAQISVDLATLAAEEHNKEIPVPSEAPGDSPRERARHVGLAVHYGEPEVKRSTATESYTCSGAVVDEVYALADQGWGGTALLTAEAAERHTEVLADLKCTMAEAFTLSVAGTSVQIWQVAPSGAPTVPRPTATQAPESFLLAPEQVSVEQRIAPGTYGVAHKGRVAGTPQTVLVKRLIRQSVDPEGLARFGAEAYNLSHLRHPNIISCLGVVLRPPFALITDFATQGSLKEALPGAAPSEDTRIRMALGVAQGLAYLHENGIVHGSLRPSNIMLTEGNVPRLADYALAHLKESMQTMTGTGTTSYTAPEILRGAGSTAASDVYSMAICLWELFVWKTAHVGIPAMAVAMKVLAKGLRPAIPTAADAEVRSLLTAAWADKPENRPTARAVASKLAQIVKL